MRQNSSSSLSLSDLTTFPLVLIKRLDSFFCKPSTSFLVRVFDNSAALQTLRHLFKSRSGILTSSSWSCWSWIPQTIRSLSNESLGSPKLQVVANSLKSAMIFSCDLPGSWVREKNLKLSTVSFFLGLQCPSKAAYTCIKVLATLELRRPSYHKFPSLDCRLNTEIILLSSSRPYRSSPNPC